MVLQNLVSAEDECTDEKVAFWSQFVDLYYKTVGGAVSCCYSDLCNDGSSAVGLYPPAAAQFPAAAAAASLGDQPPELNRVSQFLSHREGNCEKYFEKINSDEWVPDILGTILMTNHLHVCFSSL